MLHLLLTSSCCARGHKRNTEGRLSPRWLLEPGRHMALGNQQALLYTRKAHSDACCWVHCARWPLLASGGAAQLWRVQSVRLLDGRALTSLASRRSAPPMGGKPRSGCQQYHPSKPVLVESLSLQEGPRAGVAARLYGRGRRSMATKESTSMHRLSQPAALAPLRAPPGQCRTSIHFNRCSRVRRLAAA
jgi:hypothetical protein